MTRTGVPTSWTSLPPTGETIEAEIHLNGTRTRAGSKPRLIFRVVPDGHAPLVAHADVTDEVAQYIVETHPTSCTLLLKYDEKQACVVITHAVINGKRLKLHHTPQ